MVLLFYGVYDLVGQAIYSMSPERELAERIYNGLIPHGPETSREFPDPVDFIESRVKEAMEKAKQDGFIEEAIGCDEHCEKAKFDERERCAKIAESHQCYGADARGAFGATIAARIREGK
jgi:hypothetical protein